MEQDGCRLEADDHPRVGRVLQAVLSGRHDPDFWEGVRGLLREEIARRSPQCLVFDLRALDCIVGRVCEAFDVDRATAAEDTTTFVEQLSRRGLLTVLDAPHEAA